MVLHRNGLFWAALAVICATECATRRILCNRTSRSFPCRELLIPNPVITHALSNHFVPWWCNGNRLCGPETLAEIMNKDPGWSKNWACWLDHPQSTAGHDSKSHKQRHPWPRWTATALHGWNNNTHRHVSALKKFRSVGITLVPEIDECFTIPTSHLMGIGPRRPAAENQGPDIVLLKIPEAKLGEIKARKSFYPLTPVAQKPRVEERCIEIAMLLGAPGESAKLMTPRNLDMTIHGIMADHKAKKFTNGRYDYIDSKEFFGAHGFPKSYGGFSGGGLWHVHVYLDPKLVNARSGTVSQVWPSTNSQQSGSTESSVAMAREASTW